MDYQTGTPLWVYWLADRSEMTPEANAALIGDLSWTRRPMGLFTPINHAHGNSAPAKARRNNLPEHNIAEDMRWTRLSSDHPTLLQLATERGELVHSAEQRFILLPTVLTDFAQRWANDIPWIESYRSEAKLFYLYLAPDE